ncbi:hypothetical protein MKEN_00025400 [Mycena kentingensis (nom. inval.)]|nr:hypothetical protein MKEN_00025400 [Mycena kentingensis (nom. inval.)]
MSSTIPADILGEIAAFASSPALLNLSLVDHASNAAVQPYLYEQITISFNTLFSLSRTLRTHPERAATCKSVALRPPRLWNRAIAKHYQVPEEITAEHIADELVALFRLLAERAQLLAVTYDWMVRHCSAEKVSVTAAVWAAIALSSPSLRNLDIGLAEPEWTALLVPHYPSLRILKVDLSSAHGWPCEELQSMLDSRCPLLEELVIDLPECCGTQGITFATNNHPHLKTLHLTTPLQNLTRIQSGGEDFLIRHQWVEILSLHGESGPYFRPPGSNSSLRALAIQQHEVYPPEREEEPDTLAPYGTNIVQLSLADADDLDEPPIRHLVRSLAASLRCLHLGCWIPRERVMSDLVDIASCAPLLEELQLSIAPSVDDLRTLLTASAETLPLPARARFSVNDTVELTQMYSIYPKGSTGKVTSVTPAAKYTPTLYDIEFNYGSYTQAASGIPENYLASA